MVQVTFVSWAFSLIGILPLAAGRLSTRPGYQELQAMIDGSQEVTLNQGYPWEGGYEDIFAGRADCVADVPQGLGPATSPDTAAAFTANTVYSGNANTFGVTNSTYSVVTINTLGSVIPTARDPNPIGYLGWMNMPSYNPYNCSLICNNIGSGSCKSYNIYYLRSPVVAPGAACPTPASMTNIVCGFYANFTNYWNMVNYGENRVNFSVVVAGSNNYNKIS